MSNSCTVGGWFNYPRHLLTDAQVGQYKELLTYKSPFMNDDGSYKTIAMYEESDTHFSMPIEWVRNTFPTLFQMATPGYSEPEGFAYTRLPDPNHPAVKDPAGQKKFMDELLLAVQEYNNVFAVAKTGSGKTVCALRTAALLGLKTLVLVDKSKYKDQWIREIQDKLGVDRERIGIIQQDKCEIEGKDIVVGLMQTNARRQYTDDVYNAFGTIIIDEVDVIGTEFFGDILPKFKARYRIGLTATPSRKDGADCVMTYHLGPIRVRSEAEVLPVKVHVFKYYKEGKVWGRDENQQILAISKDKEFNAILARDILKCYNAGRDILVVAEKIDQIEKLTTLIKELGIDKSEIGQFTAQCAKYDKTYDWKIVGRRKTTDAELDEALKKKIVFATPGMVTRAIDVPRWDTLIEASPLWRGAQLLGRVRRPCQGKKYPISFTYRHMKSNYAEQRYYSRLREYEEVGATIFHH